MKLVCISDTHGDHEQVELPPGDVLIHAGDTTAHGTEDDYRRFLNWFSAQPHQHRLFIAGNHDFYLENEPDRARAMAEEAGVVYLNDSGATVEGVNFWGSPITPRFLDWAFMRDPGEDIEQHWRLIPPATDVLITHGPPHGVLDVIQRSASVSEHTGCPSLLNTIDALPARLHVFGHIHEGHGSERRNGTLFRNVATMDEHYRIVNAPVVMVIPTETTQPIQEEATS